MKVHNFNNQEYPVNNKPQKSPAFRAGMTDMLNMSGNLMQGIENSGFLGSFLIQDFCGMTIPRTAAGFLRDKEHTGHYNMQEGKEVFGREGLTGPCMMAVAPLSLLIAAKFGRTTSVNTQLIKRFGNSLKEILTNPNFDKGLLKQPERFKQEFYRTNIEKILNDTLGKENTQKESVEYILKQINNMEKIPADAKLKKFRGKAKYRSECMNNIMEHIDNIRYSTSSDLNMLQKVKFGSDKLDCKKAFSTKNTIDAMIKYSDDAIIVNKHLDKLDELSAESIKNKVCEIKVQHSETAGTEITKIDKLVPNFQYTKGKYNHNTSAMIQSDLSLMNYDNPAVLLSGNIKTLVVPVDTAEKYDDDCYMAKYRIENDVSTHNVEFYGIPKDSQTPKLLVMKTVLSEVGTAGGDNETCILTEGVSKGVNEDDEECYFAQAYDKNGNEITLTIRNDFRFADSSVKNAIMDLCAGDVMEIGRDGQNRVLEIKVMASASRPIDGTQMGIIEKLQQNVIWNKSNGDDFYNVFFYMNDDDERVEAGIKAEYPIFRYTQGRNGYVDKISAADILTDENGVNADTVIIAGDIAVILPLD